MSDDDRDTRDIEALADKVRQLLQSEGAEYSIGLTALISVIGRTVGAVSIQSTVPSDPPEDQVKQFLSTFDDGMEMVIRTLQNMKAIALSEFTGADVKVMSVDPGVTSETTVVFSGEIKEELERLGLTEEELIAAINSKRGTTH